MTENHRFWKVDEMFEFCDTDKSRTVSKKELEAALRLKGCICAPGDVEMLLRRVNASDADHLTFEEFNEAMSEWIILQEQISTVGETSLGIAGEQQAGGFE